MLRFDGWLINLFVSEQNLAYSFQILKYWMMNPIKSGGASATPFHPTQNKNKNKTQQKQ